MSRRLHDDELTMQPGYRSLAYALVLGAAGACHPAAAPHDTCATQVCTGATPFLDATDLPGDVLTQHNDASRTGAILTETQLTPSKISSSTFGLVARLPVDGEVYAQPLYVQNVPIDGTATNLLLVATEHNSVYAFDTDRLDAPPVWQVNLGPSMPMSDFPGESNFSTEIGITSTPVVDPNTGTVYVVRAERTLDNNNNKVYTHWLHALSLVDGTDRTNSPQRIAASVKGTGSESQNDTVTFDSFISLQRTSLLLYRGVVYFGASAHAYSTLYHGWFFGYDAATLQQKSVMNTTSDSAQGGVWMSGAGPSVDSEGYLYVTTGNGLNADPNTQHQESLLKFTADANGFVLNDWFTASNWQAMDANDKDFGSSGALLVPGTHVGITGDKSGNLYFLDTRSLQHMKTDDSQCLSKIAMGMGTGFYGAPVYYAGSHGPRVYAWAALDKLKAYAVSEGQGPTAAVDSAGSSEADTPASMPGGVLSISASADDPTSGIVWTAITTAGNASGESRPGTLYAYAADNLGAGPLYTSDQVNARDTLGTLGKFTPPTVAHGRVYVATLSKSIAVYGLLAK